MSDDAHGRPSGVAPEPLYDVNVATPTHAERARTLVAQISTGTLCTLTLFTVQPSGNVTVSHDRPNTPLIENVPSGATAPACSPKAPRDNGLGWPVIRSAMVTRKRGSSGTPPLSSMTRPVTVRLGTFSVDDFRAPPAGYRQDVMIADCLAPNLYTISPGKIPDVFHPRVERRNHSEKRNPLGTERERPYRPGGFGSACGGA
jgi:hypothetical protein